MPKLKPVLAPIGMMYLEFTRMRQLAVLQLQHCAILSQLNKHDAALELATKTGECLLKITE